MSSLTQILRNHDIVPNLLPEEGVRDIKQVHVVFQHGEHTSRLSPGDEIKRDMTLSKPKLSFDGEAGKQFVIIETDPDLFYKQDQMSGQVRHWVQLVTFDSSGIVRYGDAISEYVECAPALGSGKHRYIFILCSVPNGVKLSPSDFEQSQSSNKDDSEQILKDRMKFDAAKYIQEKGLQIVGVNFMYVHPTVKSTGDNLKLAGESLAKKIIGQ